MSIQYILCQPQHCPPSEMPWRMVVERLSWYVTCHDSASWKVGSHNTDISAKDTVKNSGARVIIKYLRGSEEKLSLLTCLYDTNFKAEAEPSRQDQPMQSRALVPPAASPSLLMLCPSCRPSSPRNTKNWMVCHLLWTFFAEPIQSSCSTLLRRLRSHCSLVHIWQWECRHTGKGRLKQRAGHQVNSHQRIQGLHQGKAMQQVTVTPAASTWWQIWPVPAAVKISARD